MDMLGNKDMRNIVNRYYEDSREPRRVKKAINTAFEKEMTFTAEDEIDSDYVSTKYKAIRCEIRELIGTIGCFHWLIILL